MLGELKLTVFTAFGAHDNLEVCLEPDMYMSFFYNFSNNINEKIYTNYTYFIITVLG